MSAEHPALAQRWLHQLQEAIKERDEARKRTAMLLRQIGKPGVCKGCARAIMCRTHANGKNVPYDYDGQNHFGSCEMRDLFKTGRKS